MKKKRISGVLCCLVAAVCLLSGCAQKPDSASDQSSGTASEPVSVHHDDADSIFLNIRPDWTAFRLENAEGEVLEWNTMEMTGTMDYWDVQHTVGYSSDGLLLRVPASESLKFVPNEYDVELSVSTPTQWCYVKGWAINSLLIEDNRILLKAPEENPLQLIHRINDSASGYLNESSLPYVFLYGSPDASVVTMTPSPTNYAVKGIMGDYALYTTDSPPISDSFGSFYVKGDSLTSVEGIAQSGDVISLPISGHCQAGQSGPVSDEKSLLLDIALDGPFHLENAKGEFFDYDGTNMTSTMEHWDAQFAVGDPTNLLVRIPASEALKLSSQGELTTFSVSGHDRMYYVYGGKASSTVIEDDRISLEGKDMYFTVVHRIDDSGSDNITNSSLPYVRLDAHTEEAAAITMSATDCTVEGITGDYTLRTFYTQDTFEGADDIRTKETGVAEAEDVISMPIPGDSPVSYDDTDSVFLSLTPHGPFHLENTEGEVLDYDGMDVFGNMKHWDSGRTFYSAVTMNVPASEAFIFTLQGDEVEISVSGFGRWSRVEGTGITSVVVENGRVSLEGDSLDFYLLYRPNNDSSLPYVRLEAHAEGTATMTSSETDFTVEGITGDYTLQTMYSKDDVLTEEVGTAEPGEVISQPIRGR